MQHLEEDTVRNNEDAFPPIVFEKKATELLFPFPSIFNKYLLLDILPLIQ
jgi:hypothetical protein